MDSVYFISGPYFYLLRMCFIITHSLQSVWRHDPHPINNTRRHFVVTGSHQARQQASHPSGPALLIILNQKGQWPNYSISQSDVLKLTSPRSNQPQFYIDVNVIFLTHLFRFQSDTRRYQDNNDAGLQYTVTNTQGIVFCLSVDHVTRETRWCPLHI